MDHPHLNPLPNKGEEGVIDRVDSWVDKHLEAAILIEARVNAFSRAF